MDIGIWMDAFEVGKRAMLTFPLENVGLQKGESTRARISQHISISRRDGGKMENGSASVDQFLHCESFTPSPFSYSST